jgi:hypothetical protein
MREPRRVQAFGVDLASAMAARLSAGETPLLGTGSKRRYIRGPVVQRRGVKIGAIRPHKGVRFGIDADLLEQ